MGRGRVILKLFPVLPSMTLKTTGTAAVGYYANKNLGLSTLETVQVNLLPTMKVYNLSNYTSDNVASQAHVEPQRARSFRWEELGIELFDLERSLDD
jgi:hypothetical protein